MSKYRKVDTRIWNDAKFMALSDDGKLVFVLLLTHPNLTSVGAMKASVTSLADDLQWSPERFAKGFAEPCRKGLVEHDQKGRLIALPNFFRYNAPENPNVLKSWVSSLDLLPECGLKAVIIQRILTLSEGLGEGFQKGFPKAALLSRIEALSNQEQEQEQEQEHPKSSQGNVLRLEGSSAGDPIPLAGRVG